MRTLARILVCAFALLLPSGLLAEEPEVAWPLPVAGTRVAYRTTIDFESDAKVEAFQLQHVYLEREHAVRVEPEGDGVLLVVTQGRRRGTLRAKTGEQTFHTPLPLSVLRRSNVLAGHAEAAGTRVTIPVGADGRPEAKPNPNVTWPVSAFACGHLVPSPPPEAPRVGLAWEAGAIPPVGGEEELLPIPATFEIEALDEASVTIRIGWPDMGMVDGSAFASLEQVLRLSRSDGLPIEGRFEGGVRTGIPWVPNSMQPIGVSTKVKGRMERRPWAEPLPDATRVDALLSDLTSVDGAVRTRAASDLGALWPDGARAVPALLMLRADEDPAARDAATKSLEALGDRSVAEIVAFLRAADDPERQAYGRIVENLVGRGGQTTPSFSAATLDQAPRAGSLHFILRWGDSDTAAHSVAASVVSPLVERVVRDGLELSDPDTARFAAACAAVAGCALLPRSAERETPAALLALIEDPQAHTALTALSTIGRLGVTTDEVFAALGRPGAKRSESWISALGVALRLLGHPSGWTLEAKALESENLWIRADGAIKLANHSVAPSRTVPVLSAALDGMELTRENAATEMGWRVVRALGGIGPLAIDSAPRLEAHLKSFDADAFPREAARLAAALCRIRGPKEAWVDLVLAGLRRAVEAATLDPHDVEPWLEAVAARDHELPPACVERVRKTLDWMVSEASMQMAPDLMAAFARLGPAAADSVPTILDALATVEGERQRRVPEGWDPTAMARWLADSDALFGVVFEARLGAVDALGVIGAGAKAAVPELERLAAESDLAMRVLAARALRRMGSASER